MKMKYVKGDVIKYQGVEGKVLGWDFLTGEYSVQFDSKFKPMFVDGKLLEQYGTLVKGAVLDGFETFMAEPPPIPDSELWCRCAESDKQLVRVRVLHKDHAICRTCKKEDNGYYGKKFLEGGNK